MKKVDQPMVPNPLRLLVTMDLFHRGRKTRLAIAMGNFLAIELAEPGINPAAVDPNPFALATLTEHDRPSCPMYGSINHAGQRPSPYNRKSLVLMDLNIYVG